MKKDFLKLNKQHIKTIQKPKTVTLTLHQLSYQLLYQLFSYLVHKFEHLLFIQTISATLKDFVRSQWGKKLMEKLLRGKQSDNPRALLMQQVKSRLKKDLQIFEKNFDRLFEYGSSRQNLPNKMVEKLQLQFSVRLNKLTLDPVPAKIMKYNFSSYFQLKVAEIQTLKFSLHEKIDVQVTVRSKRLKANYTCKRSIKVADILKNAVKEKCFCYYHEENFLLTFFQEDSSFLYLLFQLSFSEILQQFRLIYLADKSIHPRPWEDKFPYDSIQEYVRYQADFQIFIFLHSDSKKSFHYTNTKAYPLKDSGVLFRLDVKQPYQNYPFLLDNKLGMSEKIKGLVMMELLVKDRDRILLVSSGFTRWRDLSQKEICKEEGFMDRKWTRVIELSDEKFRVRVLGGEAQIGVVELQLREKAIRSDMQFFLLKRKTYETVVKLLFSFDLPHLTLNLSFLQLLKDRVQLNALQVLSSQKLLEAFEASRNQQLDNEYLRKFLVRLSAREDELLPPWEQQLQFKGISLKRQAEEEEKQALKAMLKRIIKN